MHVYIKIFAVVWGNTHVCCELPKIKSYKKVLVYFHQYVTLVFKITA